MHNMPAFQQRTLLLAGILSLARPSLTQATGTACYNPEATMPVQGCVSGVHIIAVRGSDQSSTANQGEGNLLGVSNGVLAQIADSNSVGLQYPDSPAHKPCYDSSEEAGVMNLKTAIRNYVTSCPSTRIVLLGSSQGAQVVADSLCGSVFDPSQQAPIPYAEYGSHIAAIALFGELTRNHTAPWNRGNASTNTANGFFPRQNLEPCMPYASRMASYCTAGDYYCDSSYGVSESQAMYIHGQEDFTYGGAAVGFLVDTIRAG